MNDTFSNLRKRHAAGCIFYAKDTGNFLFGKRSFMVDDPHTWGSWGGTIDDGETPEQAIIREMYEECGYKNSNIELIKFYEYVDDYLIYTNFICVVPRQFIPVLNWEHDDYIWVEYNNWPEPLHNGIKIALLNSLSKKIIKNKVLNKISTDSMVETLINNNKNVLTSELLESISELSDILMDAEIMNNNYIPPSKNLINSMQNAKYGIDMLLIPLNKDNVELRSIYISDGDINTTVRALNQLLFYADNYNVIIKTGLDNSIVSSNDIQENIDKIKKWFLQNGFYLEKNSSNNKYPLYVRTPK